MIKNLANKAIKGSILAGVTMSSDKKEHPFRKITFSLWTKSEGAGAFLDELKKDSHVTLSLDPPPNNLEIRVDYPASKTLKTKSRAKR